MTRGVDMTCPICGDDGWRTVLNGPGFRIDWCASGCIGRTIPRPEFDELCSLPLDGQPPESAPPDDPGSGHFRLARQLLDVIGEFQPAGRLLDVGCGLGHLLKSALDRGYEAVGLDASPAAAEFARSAFGIKPIVGFFPGYEFGSRSFDIVVMNHVLEHLPEVGPPLSEAKRILKPDGVLAIAAPNFDSLMRRIKGAAWQGLQPSQHVWHLSVRSIWMLLRRFEFAPVAARCDSLDYKRGTGSLPRWLALRMILALARVMSLGDNVIVLARKR